MNHEQREADYTVREQYSSTRENEESINKKNNKIFVLNYCHFALDAPKDSAEWYGNELFAYAQIYPRV